MFATPPLSAVAFALLNHLAREPCGNESRLAGGTKLDCLKDIENLSLKIERAIYANVVAAPFVNLKTVMILDPLTLTRWRICDYVGLTRPSTDGLAMARWARWAMALAKGHNGGMIKSEIYARKTSTRRESEFLG
ncbi:MAG: hypothetical protein ACLQVY_24450 [Limisphaerales bacterium]